MFIHRENALKANQHISYCSIQRDHFKKTILTQNLIKIFTKTPHQIAHFFNIFSQGSMLPSMCAVDIIILYEKNHFLVVFFFEKTTYYCRARRLSVRPSVRLSSVEIISFRGNSLSSKPIDLKIVLNVREGVVHVRKA